MLPQSTVIYHSSLDQLFGDQLVELTAILDSFHTVVNTTVKNFGNRKFDKFAVICFRNYVL